MIALVVGGNRYSRDRFLYDVADHIKSSGIISDPIIFRGDEAVVEHRASVYSDPHLAEIARAVMTVETVKMVEGVGDDYIALIPAPDSDGPEGDFEEYIQGAAGARLPLADADMVLGLGHWGERAVNVLEAPQTAAKCIAFMFGGVDCGI